MRKLYGKLIEDNIDVWFDEERLLPGQDWDIEIQKAVRLSDVVIICLSANSITKEGYVQKEIKIALDVAEEKPEGTIFIVPVRLEACEVPNRLKRWQWIDLFSSEADIDNNNYKKLIKSIEVRAEQIQAALRLVEHSDKGFEPDIFAFTPYSAWIFPNPKTIFNKTIIPTTDLENIRQLARDIENSLSFLNVPSKIVEITYGPRFTRFGVVPFYKQTSEKWAKVRVSEILSVVDNLAMELGIRNLQLGLVPNHNYVGIDIPHDEVYVIDLLTILESESYQKAQKPLTVVLGKDIDSNPGFVDLSSFPNVLIAGAANSGKSMCLTGIISSLLVNNSPNEIKLLFIDLRRMEFSAFFDIPHLLSSVVINKAIAASALEWLLNEADERKRLFAKFNVRNIEEYNAQAEFDEKLPFIVLFISELSDLITSLPNKIQVTIAKLTGLARITGIHLIVTTQKPSPITIPEILKTNFSNRIAFKTLSSTDSINVIGYPGAEKLLGRGDMLLWGTGKSAPTRLQGISISDDEIVRLVEFWKSQTT
jgi:S-DNA-T family DNA segregation ATPase FtsK/SpoIIIE